MVVGYRVRITALALGIVLAGCGRTELVEADYDDLASMRSKGAISKGWVSEAIPTTATQIKLIANIDTNEVWGRFLSAGGELEALSQACPLTNANAQDLPRSAAAPWWPDTLVEKGFKGNSFKYFRCSDGGIFASSSNEKFTYFWRR